MSNIRVTAAIFNGCPPTGISFFFGTFAMTRRLTFPLFFPLLLALISLTGCAVEGNIVPAKTSESGFDKAFYSGREIERNPNP